MDGDNAHRVDFYSIYDAFFDIDYWANLAGTAVVFDSTKGRLESVLRIIEELKKARARLKDLRLNDPSFADDELVDLIDHLLSILNDILTMLQNYSPPNPFDYDKLSLLVKRLLAAKQGVLNSLSQGYGLSLWDAYMLFYEVDSLLLGSHEAVESSSAESAPADSRKNRIAKGKLELADEVKKKLEGFLQGNPAEAAPPPMENPGAPPKPEYPEGSEDLPPFPPNLG